MLETFDRTARMFWELSNKIEEKNGYYLEGLPIEADDFEVIQDMIALGYFEYSNDKIILKPLPPSRLVEEFRNVNIDELSDFIETARDVRFFQRLYGPLHPGMEIKMKLKKWIVDKSLYLFRLK